MPERRAALLALGATGLVVAALVVCVSLVVGEPGPAPTPEPTYAAPAAPPVAALHPASDALPDLVDEAWLLSTATRTGIPERALAAYAGAALLKARTMPTCGLSWNTLAAIGWVESKHGSHGGSSIAPDGTVSPAIFGPALSGDGTVSIPDSDRGKFDGDTTYDRAMGPMQMIPQTWLNWRTDASGDGKRDPQNIDDEVMAAANYLCRASPDMVGAAGWQAGIAAYNEAPSYLHAVARAALAYGA